MTRRFQCLIIFPASRLLSFRFITECGLTKRSVNLYNGKKQIFLHKSSFFSRTKKRASWNANGKTKAQEDGGKIITIWFFQLLVSQAVNVMRPPHFFQLVEEEERLQDLMSIQALELSNIKEFQVKYFRQ